MRWSMIRSEKKFNLNVYRMLALMCVTLWNANLQAEVVDFFWKLKIIIIIFSSFSIWKAWFYEPATWNFTTTYPLLETSQFAHHWYLVRYTVHFISEIHCFGFDMNLFYRAMYCIFKPLHNMHTLPIIIIYFPNRLMIPGKSFSNKTGIVTGWGVKSQGGSTADQLMEVEVPIMSNKQCQATKYKDKITPNMMCAGYPKGEKDSCQVRMIDCWYNGIFQS